MPWSDLDLLLVPKGPEVVEGPNPLDRVHDALMVTLPEGAWTGQRVFLPNRVPLPDPEDHN